MNFGSVAAGRVPKRHACLRNAADCEKRSRQENVFHALYACCGTFHCWSLAIVGRGSHIAMPRQAGRPRSGEGRGPTPHPRFCNPGVPLGLLGAIPVLTVLGVAIGLLASTIARGSIFRITGVVALGVAGAV